MGDFDKAARVIAKLDPPRFFAWLLPGLGPRFSFHGWLDTRTLPFPGEPDRICDTVAEFHDADNLDHPWAMVTEFQTEPDLDIVDRLLEYVARARRELRHGPARAGKYLVMPALVNLTGRAQPDTLDMQLPGLAGLGLRMQVVVRTLSEEDAGATLRAIARGAVGRCILPLIPLMQGGGASAIITLWQQVASAEPDERLRSTYAWLALVFAELTRHLAQWRHALEGWNMRRSQVMEETRAEGRAEGKAEGQIEGMREAVLRLVRLKWPSANLEDLTAAIAACTDLQELDRWFDTAATASSLEALRAAMQH